MYGCGQLTHTGGGCSSIFDGILWIIQGRCWVDGGPETVKEEGIGNLEDDIHGLMEKKKDDKNLELYLLTKLWFRAGDENLKRKSGSSALSAHEPISVQVMPVVHRMFELPVTSPPVDSWQYANEWHCH